MTRPSRTHNGPVDTSVPVVEITVGGQAAQSVRCKALLDPGVTISCVPARILEQVQAPRAAAPSVRVRTILGEQHDLQLFSVTLILAGERRRLERPLHVLPVQQEHAILGLDFLDGCILQFDGQERTFYVDEMTRVLEHLQRLRREGKLNHLPAPVKEMHLGVGGDYCSLELVLDLANAQGRIVRLDPEYRARQHAAAPAAATLRDKVFIFGEDEDELIGNIDDFLRDQPLRLVAPG